VSESVLVAWWAGSAAYACHPHQGYWIKRYFAVGLRGFDLSDLGFQCCGSISVLRGQKIFHMVPLKMKWLLVVVIVVLASGLFFYRMYRHDLTALEAFVAAYEKFDQAPREGALRELDAKANVKISSLIKHDRELMNTMREIADTAAQETNNPNNRALTIKRKAAYSHFQSFAEQ